MPGPTSSSSNGSGAGPGGGAGPGPISCCVHVRSGGASKAAWRRTARRRSRSGAGAQVEAGRCLVSGGWMCGGVLPASSRGRTRLMPG